MLSSVESWLNIKNLMTMKNSEKICAPLLSGSCSEEYVAPSVRVRVLDRGRVLCNSKEALGLTLYDSENWDEGN